MLYFPKQKSIFIHIGRTGGSSLSSAFGSYSKSNSVEDKIFFEHVSARKLLSEMGSSYWDNFTFAFVRNPWSWLVSLYFLCQTMNEVKLRTFTKNDKAVLQNRLLWVKGAKTLKFPEWAKIISNVGIKGEGVFPTTQSYWITDAAGKIIVSYVGRFENLKEEFNYICKKLNLPELELPHLRMSSHENYRTYYDKKLRKYVEDLFAEDIRNFNYKF